ncbi:hypothetical protein LEMLEM_LOCUS2299 [Lemmus lemmus]
MSTEWRSWPTLPTAPCTRSSTQLCVRRAAPGPTTSTTSPSRPSTSCSPRPCSCSGASDPAGAGRCTGGCTACASGRPGPAPPSGLGALLLRPSRTLPPSSLARTPSLVSGPASGPRLGVTPFSLARRRC